MTRITRGAYEWSTRDRHVLALTYQLLCYLLEVVIQRRR